MCPAGHLRAVVAGEHADGIRGVLLPRQIDGARGEVVRAGVELLPDFLKQVLLLAYYQGLKYRDIADILKIPVGTVKSRLHAALVRLHEIWNASTSLQER